MASLQSEFDLARMVVCALVTGGFLMNCEFLVIPFGLWFDGFVCSSLDFDVGVIGFQHLLYVGIQATAWCFLHQSLAAGVGVALVGGLILAVLTLSGHCDLILFLDPTYENAGHCYVPCYAAILVFGADWLMMTFGLERMMCGKLRDVWTYFFVGTVLYRQAFFPLMMFMDSTMDAWKRNEQVLVLIFVSIQICGCLRWILCSACRVVHDDLHGVHLHHFGFIHILFDRFLRSSRGGLAGDLLHSGHFQKHQSWTNVFVGPAS